MLAILLAGGAVAWAVSSDDPGTGPVGQQTPDPTGAPTQAPTQAPTEPQVPPDEQCTEQIQSNERWICLTSATFQNGQLVIDYQAEWAGSVPDINGGFHLHVYGGDGTSPPDSTMGSQAGNQGGNWVIKDDQPVVLSAEEVANYIGDSPKVCARIADGNHALAPDGSGGFTTGNCAPISR